MEQLYLVLGKSARYFLFLVVWLLAVQGYASTKYVDAAAGDDSNDGAGWNTAYKTLTKALAEAAGDPAIDAILLAEGTYYPTADQSGTDREIAFLIQRGGLSIRGGYPTGGGTQDPAGHPTILSGDIGTSNDLSDNSYHVMVIVGLAADAAPLVIEGLTFTKGNANATGTPQYNGIDVRRDYGGGLYARAILNTAPEAFVIRQCKFIANYADYGGAGIFLENASPTIENIVSSENSGKHGGGIYNLYATPHIKNSYFRGNNMTGNGGGILNVNCNPKITGCLITGNKADVGGGVYNYSASPTITSCTIASNTANDGGSIYNTVNSNEVVINTIVFGNNQGLFHSLSTTTASYSLIQGESSTANGNLDGTTAASVFMNPLPAADAPTKGGDYRLIPGSAVVNAGNNTAVNGLITTDVTGEPRITSGTIDLGAYERTITCGNTALYVDASAANPGEGVSWARPYTRLSDAMAEAAACPAVTTIYVAKGNYYPTGSQTGTDRNATFGIYRGGLKIFGGYPTGGGVRDIGANPTTLHGNIGASGNNGDNSYHVIVIAGLTAGADSVVVDGFVVVDGNANTSGDATLNGIGVSRERGGGIVIKSNANGGKVSVRNVRFENNRANSIGGGFYTEAASPTVLNCVFILNRADLGGGLAVDLQTGAQFINCKVQANTSTNNGGGVFVNSNTASAFINCLITGNRASVYGAGMFAAGTVSPSIINCTFATNQCASAGGIHFETASPVIKNSIIKGNSGTSFINGIRKAPSASFNFVENSLIDDLSGGDPLFTTLPHPANSPTLLGDYHVKPGSAAINTGNNMLLPPGIYTDLDGKRRIQGNRTDIGVYETILPCPAGSDLFVDGSSATPGDGSSWATPFSTLSEALGQAAVCPAVTRVLVAQGTYYPTGFQASTDRRAAFIVARPGIRVLGGFPAGGGARSVTASPTILSGDIGTANNNADNSYHILAIAGLPAGGDSVVVDGFTISGANADGSGSDYFNGQNIGQNVGGGVVLAANNMASNIGLSQSRIVGNNASEGGGLYVAQSAPVLTGNLIAGNSGGAIRTSNASPVLINNTIAGNNAADGAGAKLSDNSALTLQNTIISGNASGVSKDGTSSLTQSHSLVQGEAGGTNGNIDGAANPMFQAAVAFGSAPAVDGNYGQALGSPVINAGDNAAFPGGIPLDLAGQPRIQDATIDMGAFEQLNTCFAQTLYVDQSMGTSGDGTTWATAYKTLGEALTKADECANVAQILVAQGTYYPPGDQNGSDIDATFGIFRGGLKLLGGYATGGGARDPASNKTTLSGELGTIFAHDNSRHVMVIAGLPAGADSVVVDGFDIIWGNASGFGPLTIHDQSINQQNGAGIYMTANNQSDKVAIRRSRLFGHSGIGAGFYIEQTSPALIGNDIFANNGGAILAANATVTLINNTIAGNNSTSAAVNIASNSTLNVHNTIIYNNNAGIVKDGSSTASLSHSLVQGESSTTDGNIDGATDPLFVSPFTYVIAPNNRGDYSVTPASPVIDKGDNSRFPAYITQDMYGNARVQGGTIDMGAYEAQSLCSEPVRYVDASVSASGNGSEWSQAFKTMDEAFAALEICPDITTIRVAAGTHYPGGNQAGTNRDATFAITRGNLKIEGGYPAGGGTRNISANTTVLSGDIGTANDATDNVHHIMVIAGLNAAADSVIVEGFTITGANANGTDFFTVNSKNVSRDYGGGINVFDNANGGKIRISDCIFSNNKASGGGGAIASSFTQLTTARNSFNGNSGASGAAINNSAGTIVITGSAFNSNNGSFGGAVYNYASASKILGNTFELNQANSGGAIYTALQPAAEIADNTFTDNHADELGGAVYNTSPAVFRDNSFKSNDANVYGGAMYNNNNASPVITGSTFESNQSPSGGAIHNASGAKPKIINSVFKGNSGQSGAAIFNQSASPDITSVLFSGNKASLFGGAICNQSASPVIINATFAGNSAADGGAIFNQFSSTPQVRNSIIYGNSTGIGNDGTSPASVSFSLVQDVNGGTDGNLDGATSPLFVNAQDPADAPSVLGDYRVADGSPVINAGFNDLVPVYAGSDLDSNARIGTLRVDIGAYERDCPLALSASDEQVARYLHTGQNFIFDACTLLAGIAPAGAQPVSGTVTARGQVGADIISHSTARFVRRHYELTPETNAEDATADITLYFAPADFQHYNTQFGNTANAILPVIDGDNVSKLKVVQYHGTGNANGDPSSYDGHVVITPTSVTFNPNFQLWEVKFPVSGFSGFFISGQSEDALPVTLIAFKAEKQENNVQLNWETSEETASAYFEIQRSTNARNFNAIGRVAAKGESSTIEKYAFTDLNASNLKTASLYYRLKMVDEDRSFSYSKVVALSLGRGSEHINIYPNPLVNGKKLSIEMPDAKHIQVVLLDIRGNTLKSTATQSGSKLEMLPGSLPAGTYVLRIVADGKVLVRKVAVE